MILTKDNAFRRYYRKTQQYLRNLTGSADSQGMARSMYGFALSFFFSEYHFGGVAYFCGCCSISSNNSMMSLFLISYYQNNPVEK